MHLRLPILLAALTVATPSFAARCGGDFSSFLASISADAQGAAISLGVVSSARSGATEDAAALNLVRRQRYTFNKSFEQYVSAPRRPRAHQWRAGDAAASCGAAVSHRGAVSLNRGNS
jgi:hypothetical protein